MLRVGLAVPRGQWNEIVVTPPALPIIDAVQGWSGALNARRFEGTYTNDWGIFGDIDILIVNQNTNMYQFTIDVKKNCPHLQVVALLEGSVDDVTRVHMELLEKFIEMLRTVDCIGTLVENSIPYYRLFTEKPIFWMGVPFPMNDVLSQRTPRSQKKKRIVAFGSTIGPGNSDRNVISSLFLASKLPVDGFMGAHYNPIERGFIKRMGFEKKMQILSWLPWYDFIKEYSKCYIGLHLDHRFCFGRFSLDLAGLGIPVVGTPNSHCHRILWPELTVHPFYEIEKAKDLCIRLLEDEVFYDEQVAYATAQLQQFDVPAAVERFWTGIGQGKDS